MDKKDKIDKAALSREAHLSVQQKKKDKITEQ
jgi:hypothetical protein